MTEPGKAPVEVVIKRLPGNGQQVMVLANMLFPSMTSAVKYLKRMEFEFATWMFDKDQLVFKCSSDVSERAYLSYVETEECS